MLDSFRRGNRWLPTVEENLAALNAKPAEERQKILLENARKEGSVTFYAATNLRDTQEIVALSIDHTLSSKLASQVWAAREY